MPDIAAAAVSFFALGVVFLGTALMVLFNPRSTPVRWWALFQLAIMGWLAPQGVAAVTGEWERWEWLISGAAHLLPALFLAFVLAIPRRSGARRLLPLAPIALGLALLPVDQRSLGRPFGDLPLGVWQLGSWVLASWLLWRSQHLADPHGSPARRRLGRWVMALMLVNFPLAMLGGVLVGTAMFVYVMPVLMVEIQLLTFVGVARLQWHDIEVRAARSGEIAAGWAEQERLAVLGEVAATLAHEIRNPLTGARSLAQRLAEEEVEEPKRRQYARVILDELARVERLVGNLLGIARRAGPAAEAAPRTELGPLFADLALLVNARAEKAGVRVRAEDGGLAPAVPRDALAQALLNLLLNAVAHAPRGSVVELAARAEGAGVEIAVRDRGPGVAAGERERIWEPFHSRGGGTGLGLSVVRRLAREHGWEARVGDAPGGGAEFTLRVGAGEAA
ncbi:MAG TPA: HAMP domain-containing sensor histidine kinase [Longimicrobiaceae bacterium]|nr:HAMP domain-containing sensor histidine kinase [Longimicrobiaceae bacterium]